MLLVVDALINVLVFGILSRTSFMHFVEYFLLPFPLVSILNVFLEIALVIIIFLFYFLLFYRFLVKVD